MVWLLSLIVVAVLGGMALRGVLRWRGTRLVRCPETRQPVAVELDVKEAVLTGLAGGEHLRLRACSRWPERADCGQDCLAQIERAPEDCRVRTIVGEWYQGRSCVYCGHHFAAIHWHDHPPALRTARGVTRQWTEVRPEQLPALFATSQPVCWDCHVAESFRREHPELIVDRDAHDEAGAGRSA